MFIGLASTGRDSWLEPIMMPVSILATPGSLSALATGPRPRPGLRPSPGPPDHDDEARSENRGP